MRHHRSTWGSVNIFPFGWLFCRHPASPQNMLTSSASSGSLLSFFFFCMWTSLGCLVQIVVSCKSFDTFFRFSFMHHHDVAFATVPLKNTGHNQICFHHVQNVRSQIMSITFVSVQYEKFYKSLCFSRFMLKLPNPLSTTSRLRLLCLKCLDMTRNSLLPRFLQMWSGIWL